jgi:branched-subunit amino acid transport protein
VDAPLLLLIGAMGALTYGIRLLGLLVPLPSDVLERANPYLRLVAPAILSALAAVATLVDTTNGVSSLRLDLGLLPIVVGLATVAIRGNVAVGIGVGVLSAASLRALHS